jgi:hypothetical protein
MPLTPQQRDALGLPVSTSTRWMLFAFVLVLRVTGIGRILEMAR